MLAWWQSFSSGTVRPSPHQEARTHSTPAAAFIERNLFWRYERYESTANFFMSYIYVILSVINFFMNNQNLLSFAVLYNKYMFNKSVLHCKLFNSCLSEMERLNCICNTCTLNLCRPMFYTWTSKTNNCYLINMTKYINNTIILLYRESGGWAGRASG